VGFSGYTGYSGSTGYTGPAGSGSGQTPLGVFAIGVLDNAQTLLLYAFAKASSLPANMTGSVALAQAAATGSSVLALYKNGVSFGTCTFAASATTGTFSTSAVSFSPNDVLMIVGPQTADATLANLILTLLVTS
jgi:hypothetical protein